MSESFSLVILPTRTSEDLGVRISVLGEHELRFLDSGIRHPHSLRLVGRGWDECIFVLTRLQVERMKRLRLGRRRGDPCQCRFGFYLSSLSESYVRTALLNKVKDKRNRRANLLRSRKVSSLRGSKEPVGAPRRILRGHPCKPCRTGLCMVVLSSANEPSLRTPSPSMSVSSGRVPPSPSATSCTATSIEDRPV
jgi:hypothetical protein